jgi:hypothetical protein
MQASGYDLPVRSDRDPAIAAAAARVRSDARRGLDSGARVLDTIHDRLEPPASTLLRGVDARNIDRLCSRDIDRLWQMRFLRARST